MPHPAEALLPAYTTRLMSAGYQTGNPALCIKMPYASPKNA